MQPFSDWAGEMIAIEVLIIYLNMRLPVILLLFTAFSACSPKSFRSKWTKEKAPASFTARFETTEGNFEIEAFREWSPEGADRLFQLIRHGYFSNIPVYRVVPNFVAQFGSLDTLVTNNWTQTKLPDEPVLKSNMKGTVAFARAGKQTRNHQLFINLVDNKRLDTSGTASVGVNGFPVIAHVTTGMEVVAKLYSYNDEPRRMLTRGVNRDSLFRVKFPEMDYIKKAYLLKAKSKS